MAGDSSNGDARAQGLGSIAISHPAKILGQNRQFLDFFWDIAKPDQEIRLKATEGLLGYLRENQKDDELLKYTLKRLIDGLGATREAARPGFSLALAQLLQVYEELPLLTVLEQIKEKYDLGRVKKKLFRNALFGNFFGVLALFQSGRLAKDPKALPGCVQLLQSLSEHYNHLKDLPRKTLADIVSEIPEAVFEKVLFGILEDDLTSAFSTPGQLYLLLVGIQNFPRVLQPEKLKALLGTAAVVTEENIPRLVEVLKMAAKSEKKDRTLPTVALDLMKVALKEGAFELFWDKAVENGLLKDNLGPCSYMCYRLLGSALPLLSLNQLKTILRGEVMRQYGIHVVSTQLPDRFKFAPEMEAYVSSFLEGCHDPEKQLTVVVGFSVLTNQGYPVVPTFWKVVKHLLPEALLKYIDWLKDMFLNPDLGSCLDFATRRQLQNEKKADAEMASHCVTRLRKWIVARLIGIVENPQIKREEEFVTDIARFCFFHAFFKTKKPTSEIPETEATLSVPLNEPSRTAAANSFFSLLQHLNTMPAVGDSVKAEEMRKKHLHGFTTSGDSWLYLIVQFANLLLSYPKNVVVVATLGDEEQAAWKRMLETVEALRGREETHYSLKSSAFQHLLLLVGIHLFKSSEECVNLLDDLQKCAQKAFGKKPRRKNPSAAGGEEEPDWVEVIVEVLLSLLTQSSGLIRRVCKSVFGLVCQHMTKRALQLILDVLDPHKDQDEENALVVVEDTRKTKKSLPEDARENGSGGDNSSDEESSEEDVDSDGEAKERGSEDEGGEVDENFRAMLRNVLQAGNALGGSDSDEEVDDDTMMSLDKNLSALFAEQQKRTQAKKDEKEKMRKEKFLRREFKIKVLDLVEVFLTKQAENPLVFSLIDPLISVIEQSMNSESNKQEQDYLQKTADIFKNHLCRSKQYCRNVAPIREELHGQLESLVRRACKQSDSSVALYCFSASLYLFRVLKGNAAAEDAPQAAQSKKKQKGSEKRESPPCQSSLGSLDLERVSAIYKEALNLFLTKRKSPLTGSMFLDLFERHPIMSKQLIDIVTKSITEGARQHQQTQACLLLHKALQTKDFRLSLSENEWEELIRESVHQVTETLKSVSEIKVKVDQEKIITCLDLLNYLIKTVSQQKLNVDLTELRSRLESWNQNEGFRKSTRLDDIYWNVMKHFGFTRPVKEKVPTQVRNQAKAEPLRKKKKGFLPATKKRKNRKKGLLEQAQQDGAESSSKGVVADGASPIPEGQKRKRKRKQAGQIQGPGQGPPPAKKSVQSLGGSTESDTQQGNTQKKKQRKRKKDKRAKAVPVKTETD